MKNAYYNFLFIIVYTFFGIQNLAYSQKDSVYYIKFISAEDASPISFAPVVITLQGINIDSFNADIDGVIKLGKKEKILHPDTRITMEYSGFEKAWFNKDSLILNGTKIFSLKKHLFNLEEVEIVSYMVPYIGEKKKYKNIRTGELYSEDQLDAINTLKRGTWYKKDTIKDKGTLESLNKIYYYFGKNLKYPELAKKLEISETIYMSFELDSSGYAKKIKLLKGSCPILAVAVANLLSKMPRVKERENYFYYVNDWNGQRQYHERKRLKPLEYVLPVKFSIK